MAAKHIESITLNATGKSKKKRNTAFFLTLILSVAIIYTVSWFIVAGKVQNYVSTALEAYNQQNNQAYCENLRKTGFPLRIGVACDSVTFQHNEQNIAFKSQAIQAKTPVYAPSWLEMRLDAPLQLQLPNIAPIYAEWRDLNLEFDISQKIPNYIHLQTKKITLDREIVPQNGNNQYIADMIMQNDIESGENGPDKIMRDRDTHADFLNIEAKNLDTNLTANITFSKLKLPVLIPQELTEIPALDGKVIFTIDNSKDLFTLDNPAFGMQLMRGKKGMINNADIVLATGGHLIISGPFSFDEAGYLNAEFKIAIGDRLAMMQTANMLFPSQTKNMKFIFLGLNTWNKDSNGNPIIILKINKGEMRISFFNLGTIRPI